MNSIRLFWEHSPLWLVPLALLSCALAWWQYRSEGSFNRWVKILLGGFRALSYLILGLLLLNPLIRYYKENLLPPVTVILCDDSRSVKMATRPDSLNAFLRNLSALKDKLQENESQVFIETLKGSAEKGEQISFNQESSNLEAALRRIRESYEGQNLQQIILASDGIINQGSDLQDYASRYRIHTIGLGNPLPSRDLKIKELRFNKTTFLGNQFPLTAEILGTGLKNNQVVATLKEGGKVLEKKTLSLSPSGLAKADFLLKAEKKGVHEYVVELDGHEGEITLENNKRIAFVEVVSQKQKVLLLASCPHPDLKAIRSALEPLEQIELQTCVAGIDNFKADAYNLVILHQLPDIQGSFGPQVNSILQSGETAQWLISSAFTDFSKLRSAAATWLNIQGGNGQVEESGNRFEEGFQGFQYEEEFRKILEELPPVYSPGASYTWKGASETMLRQMIGRAASPTPLLSIQTGGTGKRAIFWGDGLWRWRLNEFARSENTNAVDNLIQKTCLLLLSQSKKKQLMVNRLADEYSASDIPSFRIETFNQLMEPVFDQKVRLRISGNAGNWDFQFVTGNGNPVFKTRSLPPGAYHYQASAIIEGKEVSDEGDFIVQAFDLEARNLEANHALLKGLAKQSSGKFCGISGMMQLAAQAETPKAMVEFTEWNENLLGIKTLLGILLCILSLEWFLRKWNGTL